MQVSLAAGRTAAAPRSAPRIKDWLGAARAVRALRCDRAGPVAGPGLFSLAGAARSATAFRRAHPMRLRSRPVTPAGQPCRTTHNPGPPPGTTNCRKGTATDLTASASDTATITCAYPGCGNLAPAAGSRYVDRRGRRSHLL